MCALYGGMDGGFDGHYFRVECYCAIVAGGKMMCFLIFPCEFVFCMLYVVRFFLPVRQPCLFCVLCVFEKTDKNIEILCSLENIVLSILSKCLDYL